MRECGVDENLFSFWPGFGASVVEFSLWFFLCYGKEWTHPRLSRMFGGSSLLSKFVPFRSSGFRLQQLVTHSWVLLGYCSGFGNLCGGGFGVLVVLVRLGS